MDSIIGCIIGIILYNLIIKPIEVRKNRQWCIDHGLVPSDTPLDEKFMPVLKKNPKSRRGDHDSQAVE